MTDNISEIPIQNEPTSGPETVPFSVGKTLREARLQLGLSVDEITHRLKFAPRQIEALEADDFAHLPEITFVRGFVRSYARLLQLDVLPLLEALPHVPEQFAPVEAEAQAEVPYQNAYTERKQNILWLAGALVLLIVLALAAWLLSDKPKEQSPPTEAGTAQTQTAQTATVEMLALPTILPVSAVPDPQPVMASGVTVNPSPVLREVTGVVSAPQVSPTIQAVVPSQIKPLPTPVVASNANLTATIRLTFDADSWVEISDKSGKFVLSQINRAGTEQIVKGVPPFALVIGHSKSVHLYYKNQPIDLAQYTKVAVARLTLE
jgi:cytoskeleton protein RodZ